VLSEHLEERPGHLDPLRSQFELRFTDAAGLTDAIADAQVLFLWDFFSSAVEQVWDRCTDLQWIHVAAAGVDALLFPGLVSSDVVVTNARGTFDRPIAEFVLASVSPAASVKRSSNWERSGSR
jgi:phosphoglycerate dehydrogenase-like enzyme